MIRFSQGVRSLTAALALTLACGTVGAENTTIRRMDGPSSHGGGAASAPSGGDRGGVSIRPSGSRGMDDGAPRPAMGRDHWTSDGAIRRSRGVSRDVGNTGVYRSGPTFRDNAIGPSAGGSSGTGRTRIVRRGDTTPLPGRNAIAGDTRIIRHIERNQRVEIVPNRTYGHNVGGHRYWHTYRSGVHWYGFYWGSDFYWTRYYGDRWWWYDPGFGHWVYWSGGSWWYPGPGGVTYVYVNNGYEPADGPAGFSAESPDDADLPAASAPQGGEWVSPDGKRMVQIHGAQSEAFLYDKSGTQPVFLGYLGKNAERARFSGGQEGKPLRILLDFKDGTFAFFSGDGAPLNVDAPPAAASTPEIP